MTGSRSLSVLLIAGGAALIVALLLPWYGVSARVPASIADSPVQLDVSGLSATVTAFQAFALIDLILCIVGLTAISAALGSPTPEQARWTALATLAGGGLALVLVLYRMADGPAPDGGGPIDVSLKIGAFAALLAAAAVAVGGWLRVSETR